MCMDMYKGQYRNQGEGWLFQHGYCLSNVAGWGGAAPQPSAKPGRGTYYYGAPSAQYGGTGSYGAYFGRSAAAAAKLMPAAATTARLATTGGSN